MNYYTDWLNNWLPDWLTDWLTDQPTHRPTDWPTDPPTERPTDLPTAWLTHWLIVYKYWLTKSLNDWLTDWPTDWQTDQTDWLVLVTDWLIDWWTNWQTNWFTNWLVNEHSPILSVTVIFVILEDSTKTVICPDSPLGNCTMGGRCNLKHCSMPYCWQYRESGSQQWRSFDPSVNVAIEKHYCDVEKLEVHVAFRDSHLTLSR